MNDKIEHEGVISKINKGKAWVTIVQNSACADCHSKSMCQLSEQKEKTIEIPDIDSSFQAGDKVTVVGSASLGLQAVLYAFVIPLILIVIMLAVCLRFSMPETMAALAAIAVLIVYFIVLYILRDKLKKKFVFIVKRSEKLEVRRK